MQNHESWQSYFIWLEERGFAYPWPSSSVTPDEQTRRPPSPVRLLAVSDTVLAIEERGLLDKMLAAMGLAQEQCLIVEGQLAAATWEKVATELVLVLGAGAGQAMGLDPAAWVNSRGTIIAHPKVSLGLLPISHPCTLIRQPTDKRQAWVDLQLGMRCLGLVPHHS